MEINTEAFEIKVIDDSEISCPECGAYWGHPDPKLNFPNRFKADDFCRCYNPECKVNYYNPFTDEIE